MCLISLKTIKWKGWQLLHYFVVVNVYVFFIRNRSSPKFYLFCSLIQNIRYYHVWNKLFVDCDPHSSLNLKCEMNGLLTGPLFQSESKIWNEYICWQGPPFLSVYESWQGVHLNFEINYLPFALCAHYPLLSVFELLLFVDRNPCFLLIRSAVWNSYLIRIEIRISYPLFWIS